MKLFHWPTSPYVRKVMVCAMEAGVLDDIELIGVPPGGSGDDLYKSNPLGKIPALVLDDGTALFDSPVICEYIDSLNADIHLLPLTGPGRWRALRLQAAADGILDAALLRRGEQARREARRSMGWIARQTAVVQRSIIALEAEVPAMQGAVTIGEITIGCALGYLDFRAPDENWRSHAPTLAEWFATFSERPSMKTTVPADPA